MGFCSTVRNAAADLIVILASTAVVVTSANFVKGVYNQYQTKHGGQSFEFHNISIIIKLKKGIEDFGGSCYDFVHDDVSPVIKGIGENICNLGRSIKSRLAN